MTMRLEMLDGEYQVRAVGAAVVRAYGTEVVLEIGPADGPPHLRLRMSRNEAERLGTTVKNVTRDKGEEVMIIDS